MHEGNNMGIMTTLKKPTPESPLLPLRRPSLTPSRSSRSSDAPRAPCSRAKARRPCVWLVWRPTHGSPTGPAGASTCWPRAMHRVSPNGIKVSRRRSPPFAVTSQAFHQGAAWLHDIADI
jgi:hypothetical protein